MKLNYKLNYKLKVDLIARAATNFVFEIQQMSGDIRIIINNKRINAKSLLDILNNKIEREDICTVDIEKVEDIEKIKKLFLLYAEEV